MATAFAKLVAARGAGFQVVRRAARTVAHSRRTLGIALLVAATLGVRADRGAATQSPDHFMFYKSVKTTGTASFVRFGPIRLTDRFRAANYSVASPQQIGLPADKNAEGVLDPNTHLRQYGIRKVTGEASFPLTNVRIINQCTDALVQVRSPSSVLLPANKSLTDPVPAPNETQHQLDHFICYDARLLARLPNGTLLPKFPKGMQVEVADQFQTRRYDLKKIIRVCNPVAKQEDPQHPPVLLSGVNSGAPKPIVPASIRNPSGYLVCYAASLARRFIPQNGCGAVDPSDVGTPISPTQPPHTKRIGVYVNDQFGPGQLNTSSTINPRELCIPSSESQCGNNIAEASEACDGTDNTACGGLACRADCTCTPTTCGDNVQNGPAEACDGTDNAACGGLPCLADCSCTPATCGDGITNQPIEDCDGADDSACPGQCQSICRCPGPACTQDPTRTTFAGPPFPWCHYFDGNQTSCQSTYFLDAETQAPASCYYAAGHCAGCEADAQLANACTNTCLCGNNVVDTGETCDGTDASACPGQCQSDCRCPPPPICGDNVVNQPNEDCDGIDDGACPGQCQSDCRCPPPPICGDDIVNQPNEDCDGIDDGACPGQCQTDCHCP